MKQLLSKRWARITARIASIAIVVTVAGVALAGPASAFSIFGSCKTPPVPQAPVAGFSGWLDLKPDHVPAPGNAFGSHATTTEFEQYGYAGLSWSTYDLGCLDPGLTHTSDALDNSLGDWMMATGKTLVAGDNDIHDWALSPAIDSALGPITAGAERVMHDAVFTPWVVISLLVLALTLFLRAHRGDLANAVSSVGWALLVLVLVGAVTQWPLRAGHLAQEALSSTIGDMDAGFTGTGSRAEVLQAHDSLMVSAVLYPAWLQGEFGSSNSPAAKTYGPQLFENQALSWSQANASPSKVGATISAENTRWEAVAAKVKAQYPAVYPYIQGTETSRMGSGFLAIVLALIVCLFDMLCSLVVVVAMIAVLLAVIALPALAVVGLHHGMRHLILDLLSRVAGVMVSAVLWAAAGGIEAKASSVLLANNSSDNPLPFFILAILPFVLIFLIRRARGRAVVPRAVLAGLAYAGLGRSVRRGTARGVDQALEQNWYGGDQNGPFNFIFVGDGWLPGGGGGGGGGWRPAPWPGGGGGMPVSGGGGAGVGTGPAALGGGGKTSPGGPGGPGGGPAGPGGPGSPPGGGSGGGPRPSWPNGQSWNGGRRPPPSSGGTSGPGNRGPSSGGGAPATPAGPPILTAVPVQGPDGPTFQVYDGGAAANSAPDGGSGGGDGS